MITPEMVENHRDAWKELIVLNGNKDTVCGCYECIARILNKAIEIGLASPPVWVGRGKLHGQLLHLITWRYDKPEESELLTFEHWKGQK